MKIFRNVVLLMGLSVLLVLSGFAQEPLSLKIYVTDGVRADSLLLGLNASATGHVDAALGEVELPPEYPTMDVRFKSQTGYDTLGMGVTVNFHKLVRANQTDVFRIEFKSDEFGSNVTFTWNNTGLGTQGGAWKLTELDGTLLCDMTTTNHYTYPEFSVDPHLILLWRGDGIKGFLTGTSLDYALADDVKDKIGKPNGKKALTSEATFYVPNDTVKGANGLYLEFSQAVELTAKGAFDVDSTDLIPKNRKKHWLSFSGSDTIPAPSVITISGIGNAGKPLNLKKYWFIKKSFSSDKIAWPNKKAVFIPADLDGINNFTRLPMPNWVNALQDMYAAKYTGSSYGIVVGSTDSAGYDAIKKKGIFKYMIHKKFGDFLKTIYSKNPPNVDAPGTAVCFNYLLDPTKPINNSKGSGATGPDKRQPDKLLAELMALKANMDISDVGLMGSTNTGFGRLTYKGQSGDPAWANGLTVDSIVYIADKYMSCDSNDYMHRGIPLATGQELLRVVSTVNLAFNGPMDTTSWWAALKLKPAKYLYQQNVLYRPSWTSELQPLPFERGAFEGQPVNFTLNQNYPNPFNPSTVISFELDQNATVTLKVYNMLGQEVATLLNNEDLNAGTNDVEFNASNFASGVYYYRLIINDGQFQQVKKMMLLK